MSEHQPYEITIKHPAGLVPDWAEHELRFTRKLGENSATSDVLFLTTPELILLNRVVLHRIHEAVHVG